QALWSYACLLLLGAVRRFEVAEELAVWFEHHQVVTTGKTLAIGLHATHEAEKLGVFLVAVGIDFGGFGITFTTQLTRITLGIGDHDGHFAVDVSSQDFSLLATLGAMLTGYRITFGTHPLIDGVGDLDRQVDLLDPHVYHSDAELG